MKELSEDHTKVIAAINECFASQAIYAIIVKERKTNKDVIILGTFVADTSDESNKDLLNEDESEIFIPMATLLDKNDDLNKKYDIEYYTRQDEISLAKPWWKFWH